MDKKQLTKYRRTIQTIRARGRIKSETFGNMGQCQRKKGFTLLEVDALKYLLQEFPILKSRDEEITRLMEIIECKNILLIAYRLGTSRGVEKALDRLEALKDIT